MGFVFFCTSSARAVCDSQLALDNFLMNGERKKEREGVREK